jgi:hypothetical protein
VCLGNRSQVRESSVHSPARAGARRTSLQRMSDTAKESHNSKCERETTPQHSGPRSPVIRYPSPASKLEVTYRHRRAPTATLSNDYLRHPSTLPSVLSLQNAVHDDMYLYPQPHSCISCMWLDQRRASSVQPMGTGYRVRNWTMPSQFRVQRCCSATSSAASLYDHGVYAGVLAPLSCSIVGTTNGLDETCSALGLGG